MTDRELMQQALEALGQSETTVPYDGFGMAHREAERKHQAAITALRERLAQPDQWQGLTDEDVKAPIQKAMQHFGYDPTKYSLGGMATVGFLGLVKEIEVKLREKNT